MLILFFLHSLSRSLRKKYILLYLFLWSMRFEMVVYSFANINLCSCLSPRSAYFYEFPPTSNGKLIFFFLKSSTYFSHHCVSFGCCMQPHIVRYGYRYRQPRYLQVWTVMCHWGSTKLLE